MQASSNSSTQKDIDKNDYQQQNESQCQYFNGFRPREQGYQITYRFFASPHKKVDQRLRDQQKNSGN
jgi:hypothetical protein